MMTEMRFLVDTHIFLWMFADRPDFTKRSRSFLENVESNQFYLSDASVWEASIKYGSGKLRLPETPEVFFSDRVRRAEYHHLPIDLRHVSRVYSLPRIHGDPFDRLLISQSKIEEMTIISNDPVFKLYNVNTVTLGDIS